MASLLIAIVGVVLGLPLGLPGLVLGPIGYFVGRSAVGRIEESKGQVGGRGAAVAGWVIGAIATAVGAIVTLIWFVVFLVTISSQPTY